MSRWPRVSGRVGGGSGVAAVTTADVSGLDAAIVAGDYGWPDPADSGFLGWSADWAGGNGGFLISGGTVYSATVRCRAGTVSHLLCICSTVATLCTHFWLSMINRSTRAQLGVTADEFATMNSGTGLKKLAVVTPFALSAGVYDVCLLATATTTLPTIGRFGAALAAAGNANLAVASSRFGTRDTSQTSMPSTVAAIGAASNNCLLLGVASS